MEERIAQLEKRVAELEGLVQAQPVVTEVDRLRMLAEDVIAKLVAGGMTTNEARGALGLELLADPRANERYQRVTV